MKLKLKNSIEIYDIKNSEGYMKGYSSMKILYGSDGFVRKMTLYRKKSPILNELTRDMPASFSKTFFRKEITSPLEISLILGYLE